MLMTEILKHDKYPEVIRKKEFYSRNLISIIYCLWVNSIWL